MSARPIDYVIGLIFVAAFFVIIFSAHQVIRGRPKAGPPLIVDQRCQDIIEAWTPKKAGYFNVEPERFKAMYLKLQKCMAERAKP